MLGLLYQMAIAFFDGASRGNPGHASSAAVLKYNNHTTTYAQYIGDNETNNVAEYTAFIMALELAITHGIKHITIFGDSQLVIRQLTGKYKVRNYTLKQLHHESQQLMTRHFDTVALRFIPRKQNNLADRAANDVMDNVLRFRKESPGGVDVKPGR